MTKKQEEEIKQKIEKEKEVEGEEKEQPCLYRERNWWLM